MGYTGQITGKHRLLSGGAALCVSFLIGLGLLNGLDLRIVKSIRETISAVAITIPKPPPDPLKSDPVTDMSNETAAPPNRHAKAVAVKTEKPRITPPDHPTITASPQPESGQDSASGASSLTGLGTGVRGQGNGTGSGGTKAEWRSGEIRNRDYPKSASRAKIGGEVEVRFTIQPNGRVSNCYVSKSSGEASLDNTTCRLIEQRFHFKPATNAVGLAIASSYGWRQRWWLASPS